MSFLRFLAALISGMVFGFGLSISGMLDPARVRGFLDITGNWDPSLAFVMAGAVAVSATGLAITRRMTRPLLAPSFVLAKATPIDSRLIVGSSLFGIGWGLVGLCPGPAVALLARGTPLVVLFVVAMAAGMIFHDRVLASRIASRRSRPAMRW